MAFGTGGMDGKLDALNFFLADVRGGMGAFVSVFLVTAAGWTPAEVGGLLTVSGLIGIALHTPVGALIDEVQAKRALLIVAVVLLGVCAIAIERSPTLPVVFAADVIMAVLGGVFAPTVAAITLGLVPETRFAMRLARNAVWDRIGNLSIAALVGVMGWYFTQHATFYLVPLFALISVAVVLAIPKDAINHNRARGFAVGQRDEKAESFLQLLIGNRALLLLTLFAATFHFANGAMLTFVGQKMALAHPGWETMLTSAAIIIAQAVTIPVAIVIGRRAQDWGIKALLAAACAATALRGFTFAMTDNVALLLAVQVLDGVATGIWDVLVPIVIADFVVGSGRYSTSRGVLGTVQGAGGSISNAAAGGMVMLGGYGAAFGMLAAVAALAGALVWLLPRPEDVKAERERRLREGEVLDAA